MLHRGQGQQTAPLGARPPDKLNGTGDAAVRNEHISRSGLTNAKSAPTRDFTWTEHTTQLERTNGQARFYRESDFESSRGPNFPSPDTRASNETGDLDQSHATWFWFLVLGSLTCAGVQTLAKCPALKHEHSVDGLIFETLMTGRLQV